MKTMKRILGAAALAAGLVLSAQAAVAQDLIKQVLDRGTLRVGVAEGPPYQYPDAMTGEYIGMNIDFANDLAKVMGVELEIVPATWATLVTGLQVEQYDVIFANLFATPERAVSVAFTDAYDTYGFHVVVKADSPLQTLDDLNNPDVSFAGVVGTVEASYPRELFPNATVNDLVTDQANAGPSSVLSGNSDAVFMDPGYLRVVSSQNPDFMSQIRLLNGEDNLLKPVSLSYAVRHGNEDMLNLLNVFIRDKVSNGVVTKQRDAWFDKIAQQ